MLALLNLGLALWAYPQLPERVASHFDLRGQADGWSSARGMLALHAGLALGPCGLFAAIAGLLGRAPDAWINLPHRDYWLAPERRARTLSRIVRLLLQCGCLMLLFFGATFLQIYAANLGAEGPIRLRSGFLVGLLAFLIAVAALVAGHLWRFRLPRAAR